MNAAICPLCGTMLESGPLCPRCGWDATADPELFPTLFSAAGMSSRAVRGEAAERRAVYLRLSEALFSGLSLESLRECAGAEDPGAAVRKRLGWEMDAESEGAHWWSNVLCSGELFSGHEERSRVVLLRFRPFIPALPEETWDLSQAGDGSVTAFLREEEDGLVLTVCGSGGVCAPENGSSLFQGFSALRSIDFGGCFHTEGCTSMRAMFHDCSSLRQLDLRSFDTAKVTDMSLMFCGCKALQRLDRSRIFNTAQVTDMQSMFYGCASLEELDLSGLDTARVKDTHSMFNGCVSLRKLSLRGLDFSAVEQMRYMFSDCAVLEDLDWSVLDAAAHADRFSMYFGCIRLVKGKRFHPAGELSPARPLMPDETPEEKDGCFLIPIRHCDERGRLLKRTDAWLPGGRRSIVRAETIPGYRVSGLSFQSVMLDQEGKPDSIPEFIYRREDRGS